MSRNYFNELERNSCKIVVNGVAMTMAEYNKQRAKAKAEKKTTKRAKKVVKEVSEVVEEIDNLIKKVTVLKSVQVYNTHAYRSWGNIAKEILGDKRISRPMTAYTIKFGELSKLLDDIQKFAKRNEKSVYQYVEKIAWKLDDMKTDLANIMTAVNESGVCIRFKGHEAINGKGRQLGLETVIKKCQKAMYQVDKIINRLKEIADKGVDVMNYGAHMGIKARQRCWVS